MNKEVENGVLKYEMLFSQVQDLKKLIPYREENKYKPYHKKHKKLPVDYVRREWLGLELQFIQRALSMLNTATGTIWHNLNILTIRYTLEEYRKYVDAEIQKTVQQTDKTTETKENAETLTFNKIFTTPDWDKYLSALTECNPPLLFKENNRYRFVGNQKTQRGVVAAWFKDLKAKGIINQDINRDALASCLKSELINYDINGSSIDNKSNAYINTFEKQLLNIIK